MLPELYPQPEWRIVVLTKSSCPMVDEDFFYGRVGKTYDVCSAWRDAALAKLDQFVPDLLIAGSSSHYPFSDSQWIAGSARVFSRLSQVAGQVIVLAGTPSLPFAPQHCVYRNRSDEGVVDRERCVKKQALAEVAPVGAILSRVTGDFDNVHWLDLNDLVCPEGDCYATNAEGRLVFKDARHIADSFVLAVTPIIRERISRILDSAG
jgi:hypothetical protein